MSGGTGSRREGAGEPLLLVHGITDTYRTWELVQPALAAHHDTLAITLMGHSGGRALGDGGLATLTELVDEAERDLDAAGWEKAHLVGNSLGGWIVLALAARGRAHSVVAIAPAGGWEQGNARATYAYWQLVIQQRLLAWTKPAALALAARPRGRALVLGGLVSDPPAVPPGLAVALVEGAADCPAALSLLDESKRDGYPEVGGIDCPVRIAWGTRDMLLPQRSMSGGYRRAIPAADWVEIEGAGHLPQIDHPQETARIVLEVTAPQRTPA